MVTPLDTSFLHFLQPVFVFLIISVLLYALLQKVEFLSKQKGINLIISVAIAILLTSSAPLQLITAQFVSWVPLVILLLVVIFVIFMFLGVKSDVMIQEIVSSGTFITVVVATVVILFLIAMTNAFGPFLKVTGAPGFWEATKRAIFNPRTLGALLILFIAAYAIKFLAEKE